MWDYPLHYKKEGTNDSDEITCKFKVVWSSFPENLAHSLNRSFRIKKF